MKIIKNTKKNKKRFKGFYRGGGGVSLFQTEQLHKKMKSKLRKSEKQICKKLTE